MEEKVITIEDGTTYTVFNAADVAAVIRQDWKNVYFGAVPYLDAMSSLNTFKKDEPYILETAQSVVVYFLANATTWKGPVARAVKKFLSKLYGY